MVPLNIGYLVIGNEILQGYITDTNSTFLSRHITALGHRVDRILIIGDDVDEIVTHLRALLRKDLDVIFVCGGLGSTPDDVTMDAVGKALKLPLYVHPKVKGWIAQRIKELHASGRLPSEKMEVPHLRMARVPKGAKVLHNKAGSAPGVVVTVPPQRKGGKATTVIILPGVPKELKYLYLEEIENKVLKPTTQRPYVEEITVNIAESTMDGVLKQFNKEFPMLCLGSYPQDDRSVILRVSGDKGHVLASVKKLRQALGKISQRDFL
jgi:molybdenum cofactor synthesis domain-containing protein